MRLLPFCGLLIFALRMPVDADTGAAANVPTFFGSALTEENLSYHLMLSANRPDLKSWRIDWGDGQAGLARAGSMTADHVYAKSGSYAVKVQAELADGTAIHAARDYDRLLQEDGPAAMTAPKPGATGTDSNTLLFLAALAANTEMQNHPAALDKVFEKPVDQFSVEFWIRPNDLVSRQELVDAKVAGKNGLRIYLENNALNLSLESSAVYTQPLGTGLSTGKWHHVALTYDRAPMFPYSNVARFYFDGVLAGEYHLDQYDTGVATLPALSIGSAPDGTHALAGSIAEVAVYDRWLNPTHLLDRVRLISASDTQLLVVAPKNAETFTIDQPRITTTVDVALDPNPAVDNGPVLRAAIEGAVPGTRLRVVNAATHAPGGRFYFNSLASGNDWTALRVFQKTDFELDGQGADFIFRTDVRQLTVKQSTRVAFRHFSIDMDQDKFRTACYAKILSVDPVSGTVRFQFLNGRTMTPDRKVPLSISMWRWRSMNPKTLRILGGTGMFFETGQIFKHTVVRDPNDPSVFSAQTQNAKMLEAFEKYRQGANFLMVNNSRFQNTSLSLWDHCSQITFDHINFYCTLGMVFLSSEYDHMWVTHCRIGLPPGLTAADRPLASCADGFHFHENLGYTLFEDNEITLTDDDVISVKDGIWPHVTASDATTLHIKDFHVGEVIELYRNDLSPLNYTAKVTAVHGGDITVATPLPSDLPKTFMAQNHRERSFNWVLKNNYFHDYYGRFLVYTPWARITGNRITKSYLHIGTGAASFDGGGISSHVLVDDNILLDSSADTGMWGIDSTYPVFQDTTFADNSFIRTGLNVNNTGDLLVANNYFEDVPFKNNTTAAVGIHVSANPQVAGNVEAGVGLTAFDLLSTKTDGLQVIGNTVVAFPPTMTLILPQPPAP